MDEKSLPGSVQLDEDNSNFSFLEPWTGPSLNAAVWDDYGVGIGLESLAILGQRLEVRKAADSAGFQEQHYVVTSATEIDISSEVVLTIPIEMDPNLGSDFHRGGIYIKNSKVVDNWFQNTVAWLSVECEVLAGEETWSIKEKVGVSTTTLFTSTALDKLSGIIKVIFTNSMIKIYLDDVLLYEGNDNLGFSNGYIYLNCWTTDAALSEARFGEVRVYDPQFVTSGTLRGTMDLSSAPTDPGVLSWSASSASGTSLKFRTRTSNTGTGNWSSWSDWMTDPTGSNITSPARRHLGYEASFATSSVQYSPVLYDVTAKYASGAGLSQDTVYNYPNPFSPLEGPTTLRFDLETPASVEIKIYDLLGRPKWSKSLTQGEVVPGVNEIPWMGVDNSGNALPNGAYLMTVEASGVKITKKVAILR